MNTPASRFCPVCGKPRSRHRHTVTRTISVTVGGCTPDDAKAEADAYPATAWNIDTEEINPA